jgi:hypothetical protein
MRQARLQCGELCDECAIREESAHMGAHRRPVTAGIWVESFERTGSASRYAQHCDTSTAGSTVPEHGRGWIVSRREGIANPSVQRSDGKRRRPLRETFEERERHRRVVGRSPRGPRMHQRARERLAIVANDRTAVGGFDGRTRYEFEGGPDRIADRTAEQ